MLAPPPELRASTSRTDAPPVMSAWAWVSCVLSEPWALLMVNWLADRPAFWKAWVRRGQTRAPSVDVQSELAGAQAFPRLLFLRNAFDTELRHGICQCHCKCFRLCLRLVLPGVIKVPVSDPVLISRH